MGVLWTVFAIVNLLLFTFTEDLVFGVFAVIYVIFVVENRILEAIERKR